MVYLQSWLISIYLLVCVHNDGIYITEYLGNRVRKVNIHGVISTVAGTGESGYSGDGGLANGGVATKAQLNNPWFASCYNNELYVSDFSNSVIRKVLQDGTIITICGNGTVGYSGDGVLAKETTLNVSTGVFVTSSNVDCNGIFSTIAGNGSIGYSGDVKFNFQKYPHIGPKKKSIIKPFPKAYLDISIGF